MPKENHLNIRIKIAMEINYMDLIPNFRLGKSSKSHENWNVLVGIKARFKFTVFRFLEQKLQNTIL